jgi:thiol:disulfide interchange protein DsbD
MRIWLIIALLLGWSGIIQAQTEPELLTPNDAFSVTVKQVDTTWRVHFNITPGYYLYKDRIQVSINGKPLLLQFPLTEKKEDPNFGRVPIYYRAVTLPLSGAEFVKGDRLEITWQGCAQQGVCYLPQTTQFVMGEKKHFDASTPQAPFAPKEWGDSSSYQSYFAKGLGWTVLFFYLAGIGMAFTACMYPLIPIISTLITGKNTSGNAFLLSVIYVQAMALMYAGLGVVAALSGRFFTLTFQQPWVLISLALFFILMACAMLGLVQLQVSTRLQSWLIQKTQHLPQGKYISAALLGLVSSLIIGPCMAPPLAAALAYIGKEGNIMLGALALYMLALGLGTPLLAIGIAGQRILPRLTAQAMQGVKVIFSFILLATALWVVTPILSMFWVMSLLGGLLFVIGGIVGWQLKQVSSVGARIILSVLALLLLIGGAMQVVGAMIGSQDIRRPLANLYRLPPPLAVTPITSIHALKVALDSHRGKYVLLTFYADWCRSCKEMELTLQDPKVRVAMRNWIVLKADVTHFTAENKALLTAFGLYGPPAIIFFDPQGHMLPSRVIGSQAVPTFLALLTKIEPLP